MDKIVVIAASAGGLNPLRRIVAALQVPCAAAIFVVVHTGSRRSVLPHLLTGSGQLTATFAQDDALIQAGHIYVAPPEAATPAMPRAAIMMTDHPDGCLPTEEITRASNLSMRQKHTTAHRKFSKK
jgi:chemotaxis response regulator CheB